SRTESKRIHPQETLSTSDPLPRRGGSTFGGHRLQDLPEPPDSGRDRARAGDERDATPAQILLRRSDGDIEAHIDRSEEHTSELQSRFDLVCRLLLEK